MKKIIVTALALFAVCSLSAQNALPEVYNAAIAANNSKNYAEAVHQFEQVIELGADSEDPEELAWVATAKKRVPVCYFMLGGGAAQKGDFSAAVENFSKSASLAQLYGDLQQERKSRMWEATIYKKWGEKPFNEKNYAEAGEIFAKGYAADPKNMEMANLLAICYCETGEFQKGLTIFNEVAAQQNPKFAEQAAQAKEQIKMYTNNRIATMQGAGDFDGIVAFADELLAVNPSDALAQKIRIQALFSKKDYAAVIASAAEAAEAQEDAADRSDVYFILGAAYNARTMSAEAIEALRKVTDGANVEAAQKTIAQLSANAK